MSNKHIKIYRSIKGNELFLSVVNHENGKSSCWAQLDMTNDEWYLPFVVSGADHFTGDPEFEELLDLKDLFKLLRAKL